MPPDNDLHPLEDENMGNLDNFDDWEDDPEPPVVAPLRGTMISLRLDQETASLIRRAARSEGLSQSEFVRQAAIEAAEKVALSEPIRVQIPPGVGSIVRYADNTWTATVERAHVTMAPGTNPQATIYSPLLPGPAASRHVADGNVIRSLASVNWGDRRQRRPHSPSDRPRRRRSR